MVKNITVIMKNIARLSWFDRAIIIAFLILASAFFVFLFRKVTYTTIKLRLTERDVLYTYNAPPSWFVNLFKPGMTEKDFLGRPEAKIIDVYSYDNPNGPPNNQKIIYLTITLKTVYSKKKNTYTYKGDPLIVGGPLRINFDKILAHGLIVEMQGLQNNYQTKSVTIKVQIKDFNPVFLETSGIDQDLADAIRVGDRVRDSSGDTIAEILEKEVRPARKTTIDFYGNPHETIDPRRKDVYLTLRIKAKEINDELYFFDDIRIKINSVIFLNFPNVTISPTITDILLTQ